MKNKISLSIHHNNVPRVICFLNAVEEELKEVAFDWTNWKLADRIIGGCKFMSASVAPAVNITVLFCDSYSDANEIGEANQLPYLPHAKWSVNGDLLYLVECEDEDRVSEVLGIFAGRE